MKAPEELTEKQSGRDGQGRFGPGNRAAEGLTHPRAGGRPSSEVKAMLREDGLDALPRIRAIAGDPGHRDHFKANVWLAERGLKDELEGKGAGEAPKGLNIPAWGSTGEVS